MSDQEIYEQLRVPLMRFAASLVGPDDAHDLVADAVAATIQRHRLSDLRNPTAYLMRAVLNNARSAGRRLSRERRALARISALPVAYEQDVIESSVLATVAALPLQQRAAIYLVYWEDLSPTEAATRMGVRPATLRRYLHIARKKLIGHLDV